MRDHEALESRSRDFEDHKLAHIASRMWGKSGVNEQSWRKDPKGTCDISTKKNSWNHFGLHKASIDSVRPRYLSTKANGCVNAVTKVRADGQTTRAAEMGCESCSGNRC